LALKFQPSNLPKFSEYRNLSSNGHFEFEPTSEKKQRQYVSYTKLEERISFG